MPVTYHIPLVLSVLRSCLCVNIEGDFVLNAFSSASQFKFKLFEHFPGSNRRHKLNGSCVKKRIMKKNIKKSLMEMVT